MSGAVSVTEWLLDSDPSIRWQVMREPNDSPAFGRDCYDAPLDVRLWI